MQEIDPGHVYDLDHLDDDCKTRFLFVKREGENYPGNVGHHGGPTTQEVLRMLIARQKYVNKQKFHILNLAVIRSLRDALIALETRAHFERNEIFKQARYEPELEPTCSKCGHLECTLHGS